MSLHHLDTMVGREDTVIAAMCEPSPDAYAAAAAKVEAAGAPRPPNEPDWRRFIEVTAPRARARRRDDRHAPRLPLRPGRRGARGRARRPAREADGHERHGGRGAHPDPRPDRAPARRRLPGQPLAARPRGVRDDPLRRGRGDPQHQRRRVAGLAGPVAGHVARRTRSCRAAGSCSTPAPTCSTRSPTSPARTSSRSPPGSRTTAARWTSGPRSSPGSRPGVLITMNGCGRSVPGYGLRHPRVLRAGDAADRDLGRAPRAPAPRRGVAFGRSGRCGRRRLAAVRRRARRPPWPTPARPRSACAWRACGTRSASRRRAAGRW